MKYINALYTNDKSLYGKTIYYTVKDDISKDIKQIIISMNKI